MKGKGQSSQNKFLRIITKPFRVLGKARDLYVRSVTGCATKASCATRGPVGHLTNLPRSFSVASSRSDENEDFRELIRAASARSLGLTIDVDTLILRQQQQQQMGRAVPYLGFGPKKLPKSCSAAMTMSRIDEDRPCDFKGEGDDDVLYAKSRSYADRKSNNIVLF